MRIKALLAALRQERKYIIFAGILFVLSCCYGIVFYDQIQPALQKAGLFEKLAEVASKIEQTPTFFNSFSTIYINNLSASLIAIGSGLFFGLFPIMMLVGNGLLLGVAVISGSVAANVNPIVLFITTVLPHGIFELPAIIVGAALGIRLGMALLRSILALFVPKRRELSALEWKQLIRRIGIITGGVVLFLFVAALIESSLILIIM